MVVSRSFLQPGSPDRPRSECTAGSLSLHGLPQVSKRVVNAKSERYYKAGQGKKKNPGFWQVASGRGMYQPWKA